MSTPTTPAVDVFGYQDWLADRVDRGINTQDTKKSYTQILHAFADWYPDTTPPTREDVEAYLEACHERGLSPSTIHQRYYALQQYFRYQDREGDLAGMSRDILEAYPNRDPDPPDYLTGSEVHQIRRAAEVLGPRDYAIIVLLSGLGIRVKELVALDTSDVNTYGGIIRIQRAKRTDGRVDEMALHDTDIDALKAWVDRRSQLNGADSPALFVSDRQSSDGSWRFSRDGVRLRVNQAAINADVRTYTEDETTKTEVSPHLFRHTVGTILARDGYTGSQRGVYLGHKTGGDVVTDQYAGYATEDFAEMRETIEDAIMDGASDRARDDW